MTTENLKYVFDLNHSVVLVNLEDITPEESLIRPVGGGNCANWIVGHMLRSREFLVRIAGGEWSLGEQAHALYKRGTSGSEQAAYLPFDQLLKYWDEAHLVLIESLGRLTVEQLNETVDPLGDFVRHDTRIKRLLFLHFHESYHAGQLGLLRRLLGKSGAIQ